MQCKNSNNIYNRQFWMEVNLLKTIILFFSLKKYTESTTQCPLCIYDDKLNILFSTGSLYELHYL